ncbi:MAG: cytochrome C peroxidase [Maritimibacter sp.]|nr:cytochrome C peroxidase [Maritimibacter sp.]
MIPTSASTVTLPALVLGFVLGITALALVANELGKRAGLAVPARLLLSGGLGMGVLAVGIKVLIVSVLAHADGQAMAAAGTALRATATEILTIADPAPQEEVVSARPAGLRTWRALPATPPAPAGNRMTPEKIALGRVLFNDSNLSLARDLSCASCHALAEGGDDNARYSTGHLGQTGDRNAPTVYNAAFLTRLFWDGRARSLERQAEGPFVNPVEMAMPSLEAVADRVRQDPRYAPLFGAVFPGDDPITARTITSAIAAYERTLVTPDTPYDRYVRGDDAALSAQALRGMALFDTVGCRTCHIDPVFSAAGTEKPFGTFRTFPVYQDQNPYPAQYDLLLDGRPGRFRVPSLRNVAVTAPYFHNGAVTELEEAIRVMAVSQLGRILSDDPLADIQVVAAQVDDTAPGRNTGIVTDRALSAREVSDIAAFLRALTADSFPD